MGFVLSGLCLLIAFTTFSQKSKEEIEALRLEHESELKDTSNHMLDSLELAKFRGLDYYHFDSNYQVQAKFEKDKGKKFEMPTSTERLPVYRRYGYVTFTIDSVSYTLTVYQNVKLKKNKEYKDYLFIPFRDATSRETTYGGGRYLDVRIPEKESITIDFNLAYNPYCAYSHHYSCPIPPEENTLDIKIEAGEKVPLFEETED